MVCFSWCNCRLHVQNSPALPFPSFPFHQSQQVLLWHQSQLERLQVSKVIRQKTLTCSPKKGVFFHCIHWLNHCLNLCLAGPWIRWKAGERQVGAGGGKQQHLFRYSPSQQWISCNAELHSIIWLINSWSNPLLPGFWHIFLFWGASQQFAKSTGLYRALPIPDRKVIHSELFWGDPCCTSWNQTSFVPWRGALPQWHWCKVWP